MRKSPGSWLFSAAILLLVGQILAFGDTPEDWRLEILQEEGISSDTAALLEMWESFKLSPQKLQSAYNQLGAKNYTERERAEWEIHQMGRDALPFLRKLPPSDDPEVRMRVARIEHIQQAGGQWSKSELIRQAVSSLLDERSPEKSEAKTARIFAEFFKQPTPSLKDGYRRFHFEADEGMSGLVSEGRLRMKGNHGGDGDQRLLLELRDLSGEAEITRPYQINVRLGGEQGGTGAYHVGISIGNVRALFHPGLQGGGFRIERVDDHEYLVPNKTMEFEPKAGLMHSMGIGVNPLPNGDVELKIVVSDGAGGKTFKHREILKADVIGKIDKIGLDRSGRTGGDAMFDDLVISFGIPATAE